MKNPVGAGLSDRRTAAMDVNDNAYYLDERVALRFFASKLAPTGDLRGRADFIRP
jgi:hypothetical protein